MRGNAKKLADYILADPPAEIVVKQRPTVHYLTSLARNAKSQDLKDLFMGLAHGDVNEVDAAIARIDHIIAAYAKTCLA